MNWLNRNYLCRLQLMEWKRSVNICQRVHFDMERHFEATVDCRLYFRWHHILEYGIYWRRDVEREGGMKEDYTNQRKSLMDACKW